MSLEGLQAILDKKEVVPTVSADDLKHRPTAVEAGYLRHVRTYLPISRAAEGGEGQLSVEDFEKRLIKQVKEGQVPRGYITAGYGYGKTTTALYLWQRAQDSNLVIVPPFTLAQLSDLLDATYGWVRYKLTTSRPKLVSALEEVYGATVNRSLDQIAQDNGISAEQAHNLHRRGRLILDIQPSQYIKFFETATQIVLEAGFGGLVVMPDEIQQYFRVKQKEAGEPIAPFFGIIQLLNARANTADWCFGFVMVITLEELAQIRDTHRRTDLLHRMKDLQIDLTSLYDRTFAPNLWKLMAQRFDFVRESERIVGAYTLDALGEITARTDVSDGPRTAINAFKRMIGRFVESKGKSMPYTPIDLITDFLDEQTIVFAGNDKIRRSVQRALSDDRVRADLARYAPAIKLAAAFPTHGVPLDAQKHFGHDRALAELMKTAIGDIVRSGSIEKGSIALIGLAQEKERTHWLPATVREFRLGYNETSRPTQDRAEEAFVALLRERVFTGGKWKYAGQLERSYVANRSVFFEGAFDSTKAKFPRRRVHVRLLWEEEPVKDAQIDGDVCIEYRLSLCANLTPDQRREHSDPVQDRGNFTVSIPLNLMYSDVHIVSPGIQKELEDVWSPYDLSPLVLLNIYDLITEKLNDRQVPKREEGKIRDGFLPEVLDTLMRLIFNKKVGGELDAAGAAITELAIGIMLEQRYDRYVPLIVAQNWRSSFDKYDNALRLLELPGMRQGEIEVEGTKEEIAKKLNLSNTGLDSFQKTFPSLLQTAQDAKGNGDGKVIVRFTQHPLEDEILSWLRQSENAETITRGREKLTIHRLDVASVIRRAGELGYLTDETQALIGLLQTRGLAEVKQDWLYEVHDETVSLDEVRQVYQDMVRTLKSLSDGLGSTQPAEWLKQIEMSILPKLNEMTKVRNPNPNEVAKLARTLKIRQNDVQKWMRDQQKSLQDQLRTVLKLRTFPAQVLEMLEKPFNRDVEYTDQVNALMVALRRDGERVQKEVIASRDKLTQAATMVNQQQLGAEELARQARAMIDYGEIAEKANHLIDAFTQRCEKFGGWRDLVTQGIALERELANEDPAEIGEVRAGLDQLSTDIRGEISSQSDRLEALPLYTRFAERLARIRGTFDNVKKEKRAAFARYQQAYRDTLVQAGFPQSVQWREIIYNPLAPRSSHEQVIQQAQEIVGGAVKQIIKLASNGRQTLESLHKTAANLASQQRETVLIELERLSPQFEALLLTARNLDGAARDTGVIADFQDNFRHLTEQIADIGQQCVEPFNALGQLQRVVGENEPTPIELHVLTRIRDQQALQAETDVVDLKADFASGEDAFWSALRGLYDKNYIRLHIDLKDG